MKAQDMEDDVPNYLHREDNYCTQLMRFANCGPEDDVLRCIDHPTAAQCLECEEEYPYNSFLRMARDDRAQNLCMAYERRSHSYEYACSYEFLQTVEPCEPKFKFVRSSGYCTGNTVAGDFECAVGTQLISEAETTFVEHANFQQVCCEVSTEHCSCGGDSAGDSIGVLQEQFVETHWIALLSLMLTALGVLRILALYELHQAEGWCPCRSSFDSVDDYSSVGRRKQFDDEQVPFRPPGSIPSDQEPYAELPSEPTVDADAEPERGLAWELGAAASNLR
jgi:hypothetical protein